VTADFAPEFARRVAAVVVGAEAACLTAGALLYVTFGIVGDEQDRTMSFAIGAFAALAALGLAALARGVWNSRRWALSPSITWQVLQGFVGAYAISDGSVLLGAVAVALAIAGFGALVSIARASSTG
jgi:hypothetical protein